MTWHMFERAAPEMATFGKEQFEQQRMALIGTLRRPGKEPHFHLFVVELESAALVRYGGGEQSVTLWPQGRKFTRAYE